MSNSTERLPLFNSLKLVEKLDQGSAVLFPTDTVPALGAYPKDSSQLWKIKKRPLEKPLILMGAKSEDLFEFVLSSALNDALKMASLYWPGPLTMALPISSTSPIGLLNPGSDTVGMRVPDLAMARRFLLESGPLATTSANFSGESPMLKVNQLSDVFPDLPMLGPVPWPKPSGLASTVILWKAKGSWRLIRKGAVFPEIDLIE